MYQLACKYSLCCGVSAGNKSAFLWGMAIHSLTDMYAHSARAYVKDRVDNEMKWQHLDHKNSEKPYHNGFADDASVRPKRYQSAARSAAKSVELYLSGTGEGSYLQLITEFYDASKGNGYLVYNLADYARRSTGQRMEVFEPYSYSTLYSTK